MNIDPKFRKIFDKHTLGKHLKNFRLYNVKFVNQRLLRLSKNRTTAVTKYKLFLKYGKEEGLKRWDSYIEKQKYTNSQEYFGLTDEEYKEFNKRRGVTLENQIRKYGEIEGTRRYNEYVERQRYTTSREYFIEKYGEIEGLKKYEKFDKSRTQNIESYIFRLGEEEGLKQFLKFSRSKITNFTSNSAKEFFERLDNDLKLSEKYKVYYSPKTKEFCKYSNSLKKVFFYDFVISDLKFCIEFNGDVFHANPKLFNKDDHPNPFLKEKTSEEIWQYDKDKLKILEDLNFQINIFWWSDYEENKELIIEKAKEIIIRRINEFERN